MQHSELSLAELVDHYGDTTDRQCFNSIGTPDKRFNSGTRLGASEVEARYQLRQRLLLKAQQSN